jgi:hemerythrin superfamily protein
MDIFQKIEREHQDFRQWSEEIAETKARDVETREDLFKKLYCKLTAHHKAEEDILNPVLRENKETREFATEIDEEHNVIDFLMEQLRDLPADAENWLTKFNIMKGQLDHHLEDEEEDIAPKAREVFQTDRLANLTEQFEKNRSDRQKNLENTYSKA